MKSPAINFYTSDFLTGTTFMSNEQVGAYIRLLSYQHQLGHLSEEQVFSVTKDELVLSKFKVDKNGLYFNERMEEEIKKRKKYSESRARNRSNSNKKTKEEEKTYEEDMKNICNSYEEHMENENIYINKNININNKRVNKSMREEERKEEEKDKKEKYGTYGRVKLTIAEYLRLVNEFGEDFIKEQIERLDEYVESNDNKNKYKNFNLVLRRAIREKWFKKTEPNRKGGSSSFMGTMKEIYDESRNNN